MPSKHSKNSGDRHHFTYQEKLKSGVGSIKQRIGSDSQLPFGHCALSLVPICEGVLSPSGRLYSREAILEYLLTKTQEIKAQSRQYEEQVREDGLKAISEGEREKMKEIEQFSRTQVGVADIVERKQTEEEEAASHSQTRKRIIDDTDASVKLEQLRQVSPWIVQFTPSAEPSKIKEPPKRPASPFSGRPLRSKDLMPIDLVKEDSNESKASNGTIRFICPVSRKTITSQKVVYLKNSMAYMLQDVFEELALPSKRCPISGKAFTHGDVVEVVPAASSFAASGQVEAKRYRPSFN